MSSQPSIIRGGLAYIKVDGRQYDLQGDLKYKTGQFKREAITGMDRIHGYKESKEVPYVEMSLTDSGGLNIDHFEAMRNVTVTLEIGNGKQAIFRNAWCAQSPENEPGDAKVSVRFEALEGKEVPISGTV
jgi:hypothetical protein